MKKPLVAVIMGSLSDRPTMKDAEKILKKFSVPFVVEIISAHRGPEKMVQFALNAEKKGIQVIIAGAGGAAHLPGMVASLTNLPVIGVPVSHGQLQGLDALLSIAQMPKGVPVACMAVDNATNAGLYAVRVLGLQNKKMAQQIESHRQEQIDFVMQMNVQLKKKSRG